MSVLEDAESRFLASLGMTRSFRNDKNFRVDKNFREGMTRTDWLLAVLAGDVWAGLSGLEW
jgi:hypothetical protein